MNHQSNCLTVKTFLTAHLTFLFVSIVFYVIAIVLRVSIILESNIVLFT